MTAEKLTQRHDLINDAWKFLKLCATDRIKKANMDIEWLRLYKKYDGAHDDFAHKILDAVLGEVEQQHGGET